MANIITGIKRKRGRPRRDELPEINDFDVSLIREFAQRPAFYDRTCVHYRNRDYLDLQWEEMATSLGYTVSLIKERMIQLRNRYNLEKRRIDSLQEQYNDTNVSSHWPLYEYMKFLGEYIKPRRPYTYLKQNVDEAVIKETNSSSSVDGEEFEESQNYTSNDTESDVLSPERANNSNNSNALPAPNSSTPLEPQSNGKQLRVLQLGTITPKLPTMQAAQQQQSQQQNLPQQQLQIKQTQQLQQTKQQILQSNLQKMQQQQTIQKQQQLPPMQLKLQPHQQQYQQQQQQQHQRIQRQQLPFVHVPTEEHKMQISHAHSPSQQQQQHQQQRQQHMGDEKFKAFGQFLAASLIEMNEADALRLIDQFTTELVKSMRVRIEDQNAT